jgi:hypothetical protein
MAIDHTLKDWKISPNASDVNGRGGINPEHSEIIPKWSELANPAFG